MVSATPEDASIWVMGKLYNEAKDQPSFSIIRAAEHPRVNLTMKIFPKGDPEHPIYSAVMNGVDEVSVDDDTPVKIEIASAFGLAAAANGDFDLLTNRDQLEPGDYVVSAKMVIPGEDEQTITNQIILPVSDDMCVFSIDNPKRKENKIYSTSGAPVRITVRNQGLNQRESWTLNTHIYNEDHEEVANYEFNYPEDASGDAPALKVGDKYTVDFGHFVADAIGDYYVKASISFDGATDQVAENNAVPAVADGQWSYVINIAKEVDLRAVEMSHPKDSAKVIVGRPLRPMVSFGNLGINDATLTEIIVEFTKDGQTKYADTLKNYPISSKDTTRINMKKLFTPDETGEYKSYFRISSAQDDGTEGKNGIECFFVTEAMSGNYTIGTKEEFLSNGDENPRNFVTIQDAVDALYLDGVSAPVNFILTDSYYEVGDLNNTTSPALDLTARIAGQSQDNPISFKPAADLAVEKAGQNTGITVKLLAGNGKGIVIGQNGFPENKNAIAYYSSNPDERVSDDVMKYYVQSAGYFEFNGGDNKSIRFQVEVNPVNPNTKYYQTCFYLLGGAHHVTIENCIFENNMSRPELTLLKDLPKNNAHGFIPLGKRAEQTQVYEKDNEYLNTSFSAAIVLRSMNPIYTNKQNLLNFDTLTCDNNVIANNEISGFGLGIASMGAGPLLQSHKGDYERFYNKGNVYSNNTIHNVTRYGIFLGFEENSTIDGNKIYDVVGNYELMHNSAGIKIGGEARPGWNGYNAVNISVVNNEISLVNLDNQSAGYASGIFVEQAQNEMTRPSGGFAYFPNEEEKMVMANNIVWGVNISRDDQSRYGMIILGNAAKAGYRTRNDQIVNNTVILEDDGLEADAELFGIGMQSTTNTEFKNNAVAIMDSKMKGDALNGLVYYEGTMPGKDGGLMSNRNAFWTVETDDKEGPAMFIFQEIDRDGNRVPTNKDDYETLRQWRNWTKQDNNSIIGDFVSNMGYDNTLPSRSLRIDMNKAKGSVLDDRGFCLNEILTKDIDGNTRGQAGKLFDIGACEFNGSKYLQDMEIKTISEPSTYQSGTGEFSDAEYVMTTLPIDCKAIIRNSGSLDQSQVEVTLYVYREDIFGKFSEHALDTIKTYADVVTSQSIEVSFDLATIEANKPDSMKMFKTYAELENVSPAYTIPAKFDTLMKANVTPRYKYKVVIRPDENNDNNEMETTVRYYIKKSDKLNMLVSTHNAWVNIYDRVADGSGTRNPNSDEIAGRLNYEKLQKGFEQLGWYTEIYKDVEHDDDAVQDSFKIDIFDRNSWEIKSVDYTMYKFLWWSDGHNNTLERYQRWNIEDFTKAGDHGNKKNLIIGSEEIVRNNCGRFVEYAGKDYPVDPTFIRNVLRSNYIPVAHGEVSTPWQGGTDGQKVKGVTIGRDLELNIKATSSSVYDFNQDGNTEDEGPVCGMMNTWTDGDGLATVSHYYVNSDGRTEKDSVMGIALTAMNRTWL